MKRLSVAVAALLAMLVAVAPTSANVPAGNGLTFIPASPIGVHCEDDETYSVKVTRNLGKSGWQVESSRHYVVGEFWITITHTASGAVLSREGGTWGTKAGLEPVTCWGGYDDPSGVTVRIDTTIYPVPGGGS
ncbi:MAG TPA: hypothetical protein VFU99_13070 [Gaiellaceae bacterium]|nr:hypothetical protein [Gaiellaceae bacterium]